MKETYLTLSDQREVEIPRIKGSRFIGMAAPAATAEEAEALVREARARRPDARHHCFAYRTGTEGDLFRFSDDGEPGGSAGRPILKQIDRAGLVRAAVVVTRYFGGTKLGVGGLMRAYGAGAAAAIEAAGVREVVRCARITVKFPYDLSNAVSAAAAAAGYTPTGSHYDDTVRLEFTVPLGQVQAFVADLTGKTAARAKIEVRPEED